MRKKLAFALGAPQRGLAVGLYGLVTLLLMGRFLRHPASFVPGSGPDPALNIWILAWDAHALLRQPLRLFDANIFHPLPGTLAYSEHLLGLIPFFTPLAWLGLEPVLAYNVVWGLTFVLSAWGMLRLVEEETGSRGAGFLAGLVFAFGAYRIMQLSHISMLATAYLPWALLCLRRYAGVRQLRYLALFGILLALQLLSGWYLAVFTLILVAGYLVLGPARPLLRSPALWAALALHLLLLLLAARPYLSVRDVLAARDRQEAAGFSLQPLDLLTARQGHPLWDGLASGLRGRPEMNTERWAYLGLLPVGAALLGLPLASPASRRLWLVVGLLGLLLAFGPSFQLGGRTIGTPYGWILQRLPVLAILRAPARWIFLTHTAMAVLLGLGWAGLVRRRPGARLLLPPLAVAILLDAGAGPLHYRSLGPHQALSPAYQRIAAEPGSFAIVELPMFAHPEPEAPEADRVYASTLHWKGLVNGYSGVTPPRQTELDRVLDCFPQVQALAALAAVPDLRYVLLHRGASAILDARWERLGSDLPDALEEVDAWADLTLLRIAPGLAPVQPAAPAPPPPQPALAEFEDGMALESWQLDADSGQVRLIWGAHGWPSADYTVFVHVLGGDGQLVAQSDAWPGGGRYPTGDWCPGDRWEDVHDLDPLPAGTMVLAGLYRVDTGARLAVLDSELPTRDGALQLR